MIDRLPPSAIPPSVSHAPSHRGEPKASFDRWIGPAVGDGSPGAGGDDARLHASSDIAADIPRSDAVQDRDPGEALFSFHVRREAGAVEVLSVPWRLGANAALSHLSRAAYEAGSLLDAHAGSEPLQRTVSATPASPVTPAYAPVGSTGTALPGAVATTTGLLPSARQVALQVAAEPGSAASAAIAEPWLARLLRLLDQQGHDPVLWIRDYRLDDVASQSVVAEIRSLADKQGWKLERIMVNGRELWHSPPVLDSMGKP